MTDPYRVPTERVGRLREDFRDSCVVVCPFQYFANAPLNEEKKLAQAIGLVYNDFIADSKGELTKRYNRLDLIGRYMANVAFLLTGIDVETSYCLSAMYAVFHIGSKISMTGNEDDARVYRFPALTYNQMFQELFLRMLQDQKDIGFPRQEMLDAIRAGTGDDLENQIQSMTIDQIQRMTNENMAESWIYRCLPVFLVHLEEIVAKVLKRAENLDHTDFLHALRVYQARCMIMLHFSPGQMPNQAQLNQIAQVILNLYTGKEKKDNGQDLIDLMFSYKNVQKKTAFCAATIWNDKEAAPVALGLQQNAFFTTLPPSQGQEELVDQVVFALGDDKHYKAGLVRLAGGVRIVMWKVIENGYKEIKNYEVGDIYGRGGLYDVLKTELQRDYKSLKEGELSKTHLESFLCWHIRFDKKQRVLYFFCDAGMWAMRFDESREKLEPFLSEFMMQDERANYYIRDMSYDSGYASLSVRGSATGGSPGLSATVLVSVQQDRLRTLLVEKENFADNADYMNFGSSRVKVDGDEVLFAYRNSDCINFFRWKKSDLNEEVQIENYQTGRTVRQVSMHEEYVRTLMYYPRCSVVSINRLYQVENVFLSSDAKSAWVAYKEAIYDPMTPPYFNYTRYFINHDKTGGAILLNTQQALPRPDPITILSPQEIGTHRLGVITYRAKAENERIESLLVERESGFENVIQIEDLGNDQLAVLYEGSTKVFIFQVGFDRGKFVLFPQTVIQLPNIVVHIGTTEKGDALVMHHFAPGTPLWTEENVSYWVDAKEHFDRLPTMRSAVFNKIESREISVYPQLSNEQNASEERSEKGKKRRKQLILPNEMIYEIYSYLLSDIYLWRA